MIKPKNSLNFLSRKFQRNFLGNKKGIFFTTLVIVMLSLFIITYTFYSGVRERQSVEKRIETLNSFVFSLEENIPRQLRTTAFRIIFLFEKRIVETGSYITNLNATFNEAFFNGTIYGQTDAEMQALMEDATLPEIIDDIKQKAQKINADVEFINPSITLSQSDPWRVKVTLSSNIIIKDQANLVLWNRTSDINAFVEVENFEDSLYLINTNGLVTNKIKKSPYSTFVSGSDISNLSLHSENSYYIVSTTAPSFLDRLEGINAPNPNGIESLVNLEKLAAQNIQIQDKSVIDYIYFSSQNPSACNVVPAGMPSWFKLDNAHLTTYNLNCVS